MKIGWAISEKGIRMRRVAEITVAAGLSARLFHRYAFRQVSWLVHVRSLENGDVISQKL